MVKGGHNQYGQFVHVSIETDRSNRPAASPVPPAVDNPYNSWPCPGMNPSWGPTPPTSGANHDKVFGAWIVYQFRC